MDAQASACYDNACSTLLETICTEDAQEPVFGSHDTLVAYDNLNWTTYKLQNRSHMPEYLDTIDWTSVHHAFGPAGDIPVLLRILLSPDRQVRQRTVEELDNLLYHQGSLYEAAVYVAPFLIELLQSPGTPDKENIAAMLALLAGEKSPEHSSSDELARSQLIRAIVADHLALLYPYLQATEPTVRWIIAQRLAEFPAVKASTFPLLEHALMTEDQPNVKAGIEAAIRKLRD